ncbi:bis(5'-nucleosyl)-tetraphosphatase [Candidatus Laterigemmans baculatus]|uniref:bis(5'-nucleosyl)-tetraphosphatase n=2 Tax=Candidatus Laterigemmans baculatus TaxID=2770505 RepID=UPI0028F44324|nr:NUDIX domain-containing protein [Candidatus Laterigemmans baculatus]
MQAKDTAMDQNEPLIAAGVLLMTRAEPRQFLLMRHPDRWDLPKGHADPHETLEQTALREMAEETGLEPSDVQLDPDFRFLVEYLVRYPEDEAERLKQVHYFLAWIDQPRNIGCTEHDEARWFDWEPPHAIQSQTIDPLLEEVEKFLKYQRP